LGLQFPDHGAGAAEMMPHRTRPHEERPEATRMPVPAAPRPVTALRLARWLRECEDAGRGLSAIVDDLEHPYFCGACGTVHAGPCFPRSPLGIG
jgi:hypothetical protein